MSHTQAERWTEAVDAFRAALALRDAPPIHYNLAAALVELGRHREALEHVEVVLASQETAANIRELAQALEARIEREAGLLVLELPEATEDATLRIDDEEIDARWRGRPVPVAAGARRVVLERNGRVLGSAEVTAEAGETTRVALSIDEPAGGSGVPLEQDWRFWLGMGGGTLLIVTVIAIAAAAGGGEPPPVAGNFVPGVLTW